jgi:deoxyribonuclease-1
MEADLYNLVPAIGEINARRGNNRMAEISGEEREHGTCDVEVGDGRFEPRDEVKGDVARIYFYMAAAYPKHANLSRQNQQLFEVWAKADPVDDWERKRGRRIAKIQGNSNPFIQ